MIKNAFFDLALKRASILLGNKRRLLLLLTRLAMKSKDVQWSQLKADDVKFKMFAVSRMFKAFVYGKYTNIPWKTVVMLTASIVYFVNPLDLVPDVLVGIGLTDDFAILLMVYNAVQVELDKFILWEKTQLTK